MAPIKDDNKANLVRHVFEVYSSTAKESQQQRIHAVSNNSVSQMKPACESNRKGKGAAGRLLAEVLYSPVFAKNYS